MNDTYSNLKQYGDVKSNAELSKLSTFRVGGRVRYLISVNETAKLAELLNYLSGEGLEFFILGGGSNVLFPDGEWDKIVIRVQTMGLTVAGDLIEAQAGVPLARMVNEASKAGLSGLEWGAGIPGTIGGAVRGNAGAYGGDISQNIESVTVWNSGQVIEVARADCGFAYRDSAFKSNNQVVMSAKIRLTPGDQGEIVKKTQGYIMERGGKFAPHPSAGSFFKNFELKNYSGDRSILPEKFLQLGKVSAAYLIEQCGLKGLAVGGAKISEEHANFLVNFNGATQADILTVMEKVQTEVYNKFGVQLEPEVQIVH